MTLQEIIGLVTDLQAQLVALQASTTQFTQADLDKAVSDAVAPLNAQVSDLQAQVGAIPDQVHQAVVAEDAALAGKVKPLLDQLSQAIADLTPLP